jgi:hypothetical protein
VDVGVEHTEGGPDLADGGVHVGAEQQPSDHPQGVAGHLAVEVDRLAGRGRGVPGRDQRAGLLAHRRDVAGHALAGEQRLDDAPLPAPPLPVAGQQRVTQRLGGRGVEDHVLGVAVVGQGLPDQVGLDHQVEDDPASGRPDHEPDHVAVGPPGLLVGP